MMEGGGGGGSAILEDLPFLGYTIAIPSKVETGGISTSSEAFRVTSAVESFNQVCLTRSSEGRPRMLMLMTVNSHACCTGEHRQASWQWQQRRDCEEHIAMFWWTGLY